MKTRTLQSGRTISVHDNRGLYKRCRCARRSWSTRPHNWTFSLKWLTTLHRFPLDKAVGRHVGPREDAKREADRLRTLIRDGKSPFGTQTPETPSALTFDAFGKLWHERARATTSPTQRKNDTILLRRLGNLPVGDGRLGDRPIGRTTEDDLEAGFLHVTSLAASTQNKLRQTLIHLQTWGVEKGYLSRPWSAFSKRNPVLRRKKGARRERRLAPGEETRLLQYAKRRRDCWSLAGRYRTSRSCWATRTRRRLLSTSTPR